MWSNAELADAYRALSPAPATVEDGAAILAQQTGPVPTVPNNSVSIADIHGILLRSPTFDWAKIETTAAVAWSATWPTSPTAGDGVTALAKAAIELANSQITTVAPLDWAEFVTMLTALETASVVSSASLGAIQKLADFTAAPLWPGLTIAQLKTALGLT